jgi:MFS family permease
VKRDGGLLSPLRYRDFRLLWIAQVASELGDWAARLALVVIVAEQTGSVLLSALMTTISIIPFVGIGPFLATYANRFTRLKTVVFTDLGRALLFGLMAIPMPIPLLFVLAFLAGCLTPPFEAARNGLTPLSVPAQRLGDAVSLAAITVDLSVLFGYATGGAMIALIPVRAALVVNAFSFVISAIVLSRVEVARQPIERGEQTRVRDGWRAVVDDPYVRRFFVSYTVTSACAIIPESLVSVYALQELMDSASVAGLLAAAIPAGTIIAVLIARPRGGTDAFKLQRAALIGMTGGIIGVTVFAIGPDLPLILLGFAAVGALYASRVPANEVALLRVQDHLRGPATSVFNSFLVGGQALAAAIGGIVARSFGVRPTIAVALLLPAAIGAWGAVTPPHELRHAHKGPPAPEPPKPPETAPAPAPPPVEAADQRKR